MNHPVECRFGTLRGYVVSTENANRGICYCKDCQAFAHFLGGDDNILDENGGTDVIQILGKDIRITEGSEALACMRLTNRGLLRWYTSCCRTPIGNTPPNYKISYISLVHNCLENSGRSLLESFGPVRLRVNTESARCDPKPDSMGVFRTITRFSLMLIAARISGIYRINPFFVNGVPIVTPTILSREELKRVMKHN
jgi:hypothetical protein